jgi:hypothetical protein
MTHFLQLSLSESFSLSVFDKKLVGFISPRFERFSRFAALCVLLVYI